MNNIILVTCYLLSCATIYTADRERVDISAEIIQTIDLDDVEGFRKLLDDNQFIFTPPLDNELFNTIKNAANPEFKQIFIFKLKEYNKAREAEAKAAEAKKSGEQKSQACAIL